MRSKPQLPQHPGANCLLYTRSNAQSRKYEKYTEAEDRTKATCFLSTKAATNDESPPPICCPQQQNTWKLGSSIPQRNANNCCRRGINTHGLQQRRALNAVCISQWVSLFVFWKGFARNQINEIHPASNMELPPLKRPRCVGTMPEDLKQLIEAALLELGEVEFKLRSHKKRPGPVGPKTLAPEEVVHEKTEEIRQGTANRIHYICSNAKCEEPIRKDKWDAHVAATTSDAHLQEDPTCVLERSCNFAPDGGWHSKEDRMGRIVNFVEMRHFLSLARQHSEENLSDRITKANRFFVRLTHMVRNHDSRKDSFSRWSCNLCIY